MSHTQNSKNVFPFLMTWQMADPVVTERLFFIQNPLQNDVPVESSSGLNLLFTKLNAKCRVQKEKYSSFHIDSIIL